MPGCWIRREIVTAHSAAGLVRPEKRSTWPAKVAVLVATVLATNRAPAQDVALLERESYRAHLAAAEKAIRLGEGPEARRWLDAAPERLRGWEWNHLDVRLDESRQAFATPESEMTAFAVTADGSLAAGADMAGRICVWALPQFELLRTIDGHGDAVYSVAFSPDGKRLATVSRDVTARVWDRETGAEIARLPLDNPGVASLAFSPDGQHVATCSWTRVDPGSVRGVVWQWSASTGDVLHRTLVGVKPLDSIQFAPDGRRIVVGSWDGIVHVLDAAGHVERAIHLPDEGIYNAVTSVAVSPDGRCVAAGAKDRAARVWDLESGALLHTLRGHGADVTTVAFSPAGEQLVTGSVDATLRLWNWRQEGKGAVLFGHGRAVRDAAWTGAGVHSLSRDGTIRSWDPAAAYGGRLLIDTGIEGTYTAAFTPDGDVIAVAGYNGCVRLLDARTGAALANWSAHGNSSCNTLTVSGDGRRLLTCSWDKTAKLWDLASHELIRQFDAGAGVYHCDLSADGSRIALAVGANAQLWSVDGQSPGVTLEGHQAGIQDLRFNKAGTLLATASADKTLRLWDIRETEPKAILRFESALSCVAFSPDERRLVVGCDDGSAWLVAPDQDEPTRRLLQSDVRINRVIFSPDGSRVAAAADGISLLDPEHAGALLTIFPHNDAVWHLSFSPDGRRLASCSTNGTIAISESVPPARSRE